MMTPGYEGLLIITNAGPGGYLGHPVCGSPGSTFSAFW